MFKPLKSLSITLCKKELFLEIKFLTCSETHLDVHSSNVISFSYGTHKCAVTVKSIRTALKYKSLYFILKLNPWHYSPKEPRPIEVVAARWQYRGPCG